MPSEPVKLKVVEVGADFIHMRWSPPVDAGFCAITEYVLESQVKGQRTWRETAVVEASVSDYTIQGLHEGKEYNLRVSARNKVGTGKAAAFESSIKVALPYSMHMILSLITLNTILLIKYYITY